MSSETLELVSTEIVRAGAGAGKTRNLSLRVLDWVEAFIKKEGRFPKLVVTTFTVKATQELRERLLLFASERDNPELLEYVRSGAYLHISTIHGVLSSLLRKYGHAIGLDSGFDVMSGVDKRKSNLGLLRSLMIEEESARDLLNSFNFNELAGFFDQYFEAYLLGKKLKPIKKSDVESYLGQQIQILQKKSEGAASQIDSDLQSIGIESKSSQNFSALSSALKAIVSLDANELNVSFSEELQKCLSCIARFPTNPKNPVVYDETKVLAKEIWDTWKDFASSLSDLLPVLESLEEANLLFDSLALSFVDRALSQKAKSAKISMSDIELLSMYLIQKKPELSCSFAEEFDYWLIDEFQDTSPEQLAILRKLIDDRPYYIVGDPQQSIYFFRGADQSLFLKEEAAISEDGGKTHVLMKNYRTEPSTMKFINDFMGLYGFQEMETRSPEEESSEYIAAEFMISEDEEGENQSIANRIVSLLNEGTAPSDICVLARTKKTLEQIASLLQEKSCPVYLHTSGSFFNKREVLDLFFLLKLLVHPHDKMNLVGLLRSPWFYVDDQSLFTVLQEEDFWSYFEKNKESFPAIEKLIDLKNYAEEYGVTSALEKSMVESGILETCRHYDPSGKREANIWKFLVVLREEERKAFFNPLKLIRTAEEFMEVTNEGELEAAAALEPNRVQLMTIHASKGLEFKHVFVAHMNKKPKLTHSLNFYLDDNGHYSLPVAQGEEETKRLPPMAQQKVDLIKEKELEESYRLLYVALTRAEEKLYLSWNGSVQKTSWIDGLSWDLSEGQHSKESYSYSVHKTWEEETYQGVQKDRPLLQARWSDLMPSIYQPLETDSVSRLLEQRTEYGRQAKKGEDSLFYSAENFNERMKKAARGTRLHGVLEKYVAARSRGCDIELGPDVTRFIDYLETQQEFPFSEIIERASLEWGFVMKHGAKTIEGQVDLWGFDHNDVIWVVDYKTGSTRYKDKAMDQLKIYGLALSKMYSDKKIMLVSSFLEEEKTYTAGFSKEDELFASW